MGTLATRCRPSGVGPGVDVAVGVAVGLGVGAGVGVSLGVDVGLAVADGLGVGDSVGDDVAVAVALGVLVGVGEAAIVPVGAADTGSVGMVLARAGAPPVGSTMATAKGWAAIGPRQDNPLPRRSRGIKTWSQTCLGPFTACAAPLSLSLVRRAGRLSPRAMLVVPGSEDSATA